MALFTQTTASEAGKLSGKVRAERKLVTVDSPLVPQDYYVIRRLARVRKQIDSLSNMMDEESDPRLIERLASAIERLSKIEQILSGRPMPGVRKPTQERGSRRTFGPSPVAIELPPGDPETKIPG